MDQSAYRAGHSTETALIRIFNDIVDALANGEMALIGLLDLTAAFDKVDHVILIKRLQLSYGIDELALSWLQDYLTDRTQSVSWENTLSAVRPVRCGVLQGSALGPLLFTLYIGEFGKIAESFGLSSHAYADDGQIYAFCPPADAEGLRSRVEECIREIGQWTSANRIALNPAKTDFLWISTARRNHLINRAPFQIGDAVILSSAEVRLLGVLLDESLSLVGHVSNVTRICFHQLRKI